MFHLINGEHYSGAERVQDLLASALPEFGYDISFGCSKAGIFPTVRKFHSAPLFDCHMKNRFDIKVIRKACDIVQSSNFSIIHAHTPRTLMIAASVSRRTGVPLVYHVHSPVSRDSNRRFINWMNTQIETRSLRQTSAMICVSDSLKSYMSDMGHNLENLFVVPNGVPCAEPLPLRKRHGDQWTIGTVALFRPRKGTEVLLEAFAKLKKLQKNVRLLAVGPFETPQYKKQILDLADNLQISDSIDWTGFSKNVEAEFSKMDLFVLPSLYGEGLPMVVLEAMSNGVPAIAANVEGIPQAIRDGQDGLIFEPGSETDLAAKIDAIVTQKYDWNELRESALIRQRTNFSEKSMARGVAEVYDKILSRG